MSNFTQQQLQDEIRLDPAALGYFPFLQAGSQADILNLLNSITTTKVNINTMSKDDFLLAMVEPCVVLSTLSSDLQNKWDRLLQLALGANGDILVSSTAIQGMFTGMVSDTLLTQDQSDAITQRYGTRAEILWGTDTIVSLEDVSIAVITLDGGE